MPVSTKLIEIVIPEGSDEVTSVMEGHPVSIPSEWEGWVWYRNRPTWIEAEPEKSLAQLAPLSIHLLIGSKKSSPGSIVCYYPISSESGRCSLSSDFSLNASRVLGSESARVACVIGETDSSADIKQLVAACVMAARKWLYKSSFLPDFTEVRSGGPMDGIGFCTWSSLGEDIHPTVDTINDLIDHIVENQIPVQTWILDDGWQHQRTWDSGTCEAFSDRSGECMWVKRGLSSFRASSACGDLSQMVQITKNKLESIPGTGRVNFGVWMTLNGGYWDGIDPESELIEKYDCQRLTTSNHRIPHIEHKPFGSPRTGVWWLPRPDLAFQFWHDWFSYLKSCGVDFVKVDNQAKFVTVDGTSGGEYHAAMWDGMVQAGDEIFGKGRIIHCMAHDEEMFAGIRGLGMSTGGERFYFRNSDDFGYIHNNTFSHQRHLAVNLTNALLTTNLCMIPDADMFMTASQFPLAHALLRAFFPGPLLLSDRPGKHDLTLLQKLIALDKSGIWRVAKSKRVVQPLARRLQDLTVMDHGVGNGMWASVSMDNGGAAISVWNTRHDQMGRVKDKLGLADVEDALGRRLDGQWAVYKHSLLARPSSPSAIYIDETWSGTGGEVDLGEMGCELFTVVPVIGEIAILGLTSVFAGLDALCRITKSNDHISMHVTLSGILSLLSFGQIPNLVIKVDGLPVDPSITPISSNARPAWRIDIEIQGGSGEDWLVEIELS